MEATTTVDANKTKFGADEVIKMLDGIDNLVVAKGKTVVEFDLSDSKPDDETLLGYLLGPTGNLRAPTARVGSTLLVGFNESAYAIFQAK